MFKQKLLASAASLGGIAVVAALATGMTVATSKVAEAGVCPTTGFTHTDATYGGCNLVIQFNADGSIQTFAPALATANYDGSDDALIGVVNNTSAALSSFFISSSSTSHGGIFGGMDGDGIDTFTLLTNAAGTGLFDTFFTTHGGLASAQNYGALDAYYTGVTATSGTVNFLTPIAAGGGTDYFSLEQPINLSAPPIINNQETPEPASMAVLGSALLGLGALGRRRKIR